MEIKDLNERRRSSCRAPREKNKSSSSKSFSRTSIKLFDPNKSQILATKNNSLARVNSFPSKPFAGKSILKKRKFAQQPISESEGSAVTDSFKKKGEKGLMFVIPSNEIKSIVVSKTSDLAECKCGCIIF